MSAWQVTGVMERAGLRIDTTDARCPDGVFGRVFGHRWLELRQIEYTGESQRPFRVYVTQRCRRCHMENGAFNRLYLPPIVSSTAGATQE